VVSARVVDREAAKSSRAVGVTGTSTMDDMDESGVKKRRRARGQRKRRTCERVLPLREARRALGVDVHWPEAAARTEGSTGGLRLASPAGWRRACFAPAALSGTRLVRVQLWAVGCIGPSVSVFSPLHHEFPITTPLHGAPHPAAHAYTSPLPASAVRRSPRYAALPDCMNSSVPVRCRAWRP
jgi:hypothetical protein